MLSEKKGLSEAWEYGKGVLAFLVCLSVSALAWKAVVGLDGEQVVPIASTVATIAGMLFGFILASISILASASDNTLVRNTTMTGYLPKLVKRLHVTMWLLLVVCIVFLTVLFVPINASVTVQLIDSRPIHWFSLVIEAGVAFFVFALWQFGRVWLEFSSFTRNL